MVSTTESTRPALVERVTRIVKDPAGEWPVIERESTTVEALFREYIAPLAAIPVVATLIGTTLVGVTVPFVGTYRVGFGSGLANAVLSYVFALAGVYLAAIIIDKLAPTFESTPNQMQALKLVAYASTPGWVAGVLNVVPALGVLGILAALYGVYLFYLGAPVMMKTPQSKVIPYMITCAVVVIVIGFVAAVLASALTGVSRAF